MISVDLSVWPKCDLSMTLQLQGISIQPAPNHTPRYLSTHTSAQVDKVLWIPSPCPHLHLPRRLRFQHPFSDPLVHYALGASSVESQIGVPTNSVAVDG